jgi:hypothetical protein
MTAPAAPPGGAPEQAVGPPLVILALGFASLLASFALAVASGTKAHWSGYVLGGLVPILVIGAFRRLDLARRKSPYYVARSFVRVAILVLMIGAVLAAVLHLWPIATELAQ